MIETRRDFLHAAAALGAGTGQQQPWRLWYQQSAPDWNEALPVGNGRLGAMVFGGVAEELLQLNDDTLASSAPGADDLPLDVTKRFDDVVGLLRKRQYAEAADIMSKNWTGRSWPCYQPLGDLVITMGHGAAASGYRRELDLDEAVARVRYEASGVEYTREVFASEPAQAIVVRLRASRKGALNLKARLNSVHPVKIEESPAALAMRGQAPGFALRRTLEWVEKRNEQWKYPEIWNADGTRKPGAKTVLYGDEVGGRGARFEVRLAVHSCDGSAEARGGEVVVRNASELVLVLTSSTSVRGNDAAAQAGSALKMRYEALLAGHKQDYQRLFRRVTIELGAHSARPTDRRIEEFKQGGDEGLAALYFQYARYLMIAGSRPGTEPLNLQGIWNAQVIPPWASGYTVNINTEMNYWPVEVANLSECAEPLIRMVRELSVRGAEVARKMYGRRGWVAHHNTTLWRGAQPVDNDAMPSFWNMGGAWLCQTLWEHYAFTLDKRYLAGVYPVLKGAAEFIEEWLVEDNAGRLVTAAGNSPENLFIYTDAEGRRKTAGITMGPTMDLAITRDLFGICIEAGGVLGVDAAWRAGLRAKLERLLPYQVGARGQVQEWPEDFAEREPEHRHTSHLYPLHPGREWTVRSNPKMCEAARRTLALRGDGGTGWARAWKVNFWARLEDGEHAYLLLKNLFEPAKSGEVRYSRGGVLPNLLCSHPPFQIDGNFGGAAGIAEMLLQSHAGEVHLLPALPKAWGSGRVSGLRARGGYEVSMVWRDSVLEEARVVSAAAKTCPLRYGGRTAVVELPARLGADLKPKA